MAGPGITARPRHESPAAAQVANCCPSRDLPALPGPVNNVTSAKGAKRSIAKCLAWGLMVANAARSKLWSSSARGVWDRMTGQRSATVKQNEAEAYQAFRRDRDQRHALIADQMKDRRALQREIVAVRKRHTGRVAELHRDLSRQQSGQQRESTLRGRFNDTARSSPPTSRGNSRGNPASGRQSGRASRGPDMGR